MPPKNDVKKPVKATVTPRAARPIPADVKDALHKLPTAEAVKIMEEMMGRVSDNNNANNFGQPADKMTRQEMEKKLQEIPESQLRDILKAHGIVK